MAKSHATAKKTEAPHAQPVADPGTVTSPFGFGEITLPSHHSSLDEKKTHMTFDIAHAQQEFTAVASNDVTSAAIVDGLSKIAKGRRKKDLAEDQENGVKDATRVIAKYFIDFATSHSEIASPSFSNIDEFLKAIFFDKHPQLVKFLSDSSADSDLKNALNTIVKTAFGKESVPQDFAELCINQIAEVALVQVLRQMAPQIKPVSEIIVFGHGNIEIKITEGTNETPTRITLVNKSAKIEAEFCPIVSDTGFTTAECRLYEQGIAALKQANSFRELAKSAKGFEYLYNHLVGISGVRDNKNHLKFRKVSDQTASPDLLEKLHWNAVGEHGLETNRPSQVDPDVLVDKFNNGDHSDFVTQISCISGTPELQIKAVGGSPEITIRSELGEYFVDLAVPNRATAQLTASFKITGNDPEGTLINLLSLLESENSADSLTDSAIFRKLLAIGEITALRGNSNSAVKIMNLNLLGAVLAPDADISNIKFIDCALDLSGRDATIKDCTFQQCRVSMFLVGTNIIDCKFDKNSLLLGQLGGKLTNTSIHSNALMLDARNVEFADDKLVLKQLKGAIFNSAMIPPIIGANSYRVSDKYANRIHHQLEEKFSGREIKSLIQDHSGADKESPVINDVINCKVDRSKPGIIDIYPNDTQKTEIMRIYIEDGQPARYIVGEKGALFDDIDTARERGAGVGEGNSYTFRAVWSFIHATRIKGIFNVNHNGSAVKVPDDDELEVQDS